MVAFVLAADLLTPNAGLAFWMLIAFLIVFFVLSKFAFPAMLGGLAEREKTIEDSITRAERANAEAQKLLSDNEAARRDAERQAQSILREAKEQADSQRAADVEKTKAEIARLQESARADIEREKLQALAELRREVATLAVAGAEKILSEKIDGAEQSRLVDRFIADLPQN
ncbi:F0F1 ATP synthase subunit B [Rubrivirga sp. IMCC45206]|uniref:F0F1 ATP synthase subunit B n=1 Tax=Rubrivirga sp. IMCC45206 TaxID=3391614 RepID=UPI0039901372